MSSANKKGVLKSNDPNNPKLPVRIRSTPKVNNNVKLTKPAGTSVTILDQTQAGDGFIWYKVSYGVQPDDVGWVRGDVVKLLPDQNPSDQDTRLFFETDKRLVRIYEEGTVVYMNVHNKVTEVTEVKRVSATKLPKDQKGWESYLASKDGRTYHAMFIRRGTTQLKITSSNDARNLEPIEIGFKADGTEYKLNL